jgi:hypothetical protein
MEGNDKRTPFAKTDKKHFAKKQEAGSEIKRSATDNRTFMTPPAPDCTCATFKNTGCDIS